MKDLGSKAARICTGFPALTYTLAGVKAPVTQTPITTIANGDTFVCERLTQVRNFTTNLRFFPRNLSLSTGLPIADIVASPTLIIESMNVGVRSGVEGIVQMSGHGIIACFDGCLVTGYSVSSNADIRCFVGSATANLSSSHRVPSRGFYHCGFSLGEIFVPDIVTNDSVVFVKEWISQYNGTSGGLRALNKSKIEASRFGSFDNPTGAKLRWGAQMIFFTSAIGDPQAWGSGNTTMFELMPICMVTYPNGKGVGFTASATNQIAFQAGAKTSCRAYDDSVGLYTPPIAMTFANMVASIASGGFADQIHDPSSGSYFGVSGAGTQ
jgi:hypothetical protein